MKININEFKVAPKMFNTNLVLCVYGKFSAEQIQWCNYWKLVPYSAQNFTNVEIPESSRLEDMFIEPKVFTYVDGFSPNLNKHLHIGHLSNLVLARSYQGLGIGKEFIAIFGDTLAGAVQKEDALKAYNFYTTIFGYRVDKRFMASEMKLQDESIMKDGKGDYSGTKVAEIGENKIVLVKSDGSTSYFYQDIALIQQLNAPTLYLTGFEQEDHFAMLNKMYPLVSHIGLGLVMLDGKKMSSSEGNVIYAAEFIDSLLEKFEYKYNLVYNIIAGVILKSDPQSIKNFDSKLITNIKTSLGLYVSYTMARMASAGIQLIENEAYQSSFLKYKSLKAKFNLKPNLLFEELVSHCQKINNLYKDHKIIGNAENTEMFQKLTGDLVLACSELGLARISKV